MFTGVLVMPFDMARLATALVTAAIIAGVLLEPDSLAARLLAWRPLSYIGLLSYGLYLWHPVIFQEFKSHVHMLTLGEKMIWSPAMLVVTGSVTAASYYFVERPCNRLKDRLRAGGGVQKTEEASVKREL
jgi:peptidoglycan/LPS O-acetylase OafA/YrhL